MKKKKKKWKIEFSDKARAQLNDLPDNVYDELVKFVKGIKEGRLDPAKVGQPMDFVELEAKLKCPKCYSEEVKWLLDKNSNEVDFFCGNCEESFWMTHKEYKDAIKRNKDKII